MKSKHILHKIKTFLYATFLEFKPTKQQMRVTITYCRYYMQRDLRREKRCRYRGVTITANAVMIPLDHVLVSRSNGYGLRTNCSG